MDFMHDNTLCDAKIRVHADEKPRRGRPATKWTLSRQKKLSRMYLCIPREYLRLRKITELLRNDQMGFSTRERNAHGVLKHILDGVELNGRFDQFRIGDKQNARRCLQFLRSVRAQRRAERRARRQRVGSGAQSEFSVQLYPALSQCSSNNVLAGNKSPIGQVGWNSFVNQTRPLIDFDPHPGSQVLINPTSLNNPDLNPTCVLQVPMDLPMTDTLELQPGLPLPSSSMSASNLADTKILGSTSHPLGRSCSVPTIMSSESKSAPKAGSKRESWGSSLSSHLRSLARSSSLSSGRVHTSISTKGAKDPDVHSPLSKLSCHDFLSRLKETKSLTSLLPNNIYSRPKYSNTRLTDEELNNALLEQCCSRQTHCVHRRLEAAIDPQGSPEDVEFAISPEEANAVDKFGNTLLHTAARWGASVPILLAILDRTEDINLTNKRGETFLHVLDPPEQLQSDPSPFVDLIRQLWSRGFPFCQRDIEKRNFLHYLVERKNFPVGALHCFFAEASAACSRFLVAKRSVTGERLYDCVLRKLQGDWAECQNLEELEREVKELELKLKEVRPKRNTLKEYRVGRKKLEESERKLKELEEQLEEERARLPGIFGNETEFIRRYLPEFFENARKPSGNLPGHSVTPGNSPAGPTVPSTHGPDQHNCQRKDGNRNCRHSRTGRTPLMEYLLKIGSQGEPVDEKIMEERVESGEKINLNDRQGNTALHYAAELGIVAALRILCRVQGIGVDKQNNCGNSPLRLVRYALQRSDIQSDAAMEARYLQCAMVLIEAGAHDRGGSKSTSKSRIHGVLGETRKAGRNKRETQRQLKRCRGLHIITLPHD